MMTRFSPRTAVDRDAATAFAGRIAQLDPAALIQITAAGDEVDLWAKAGFGVLATRRVAGQIQPDPVTCYATNLVAALAVSTATDIDPGTEGVWLTRIPPATGWSDLGLLTGSDIAEAVRAATPVAQAAVEIERAEELRARTKATVPPAVLDRPLVSLPGPDGLVPLSMRMLFALSGMGLVEPGTEIRVRITATWLRLDAPGGSVARRRMADLPVI